MAKYTRSSWHSAATAATFMPMSYSVFDNFNRSQFKSRVVIPLEKPRIWVCTAALTPTVQRSLFMLVIAGAIALGGGDFTVVSLVLVVVLRLVESVTIGSDCAATCAATIINAATKNFLTMLYS